MLCLLSIATIASTISCVCCGYTGRCSSDLLHVLQLWCSMGTRNSCAVQVLNRGRGSLIMFCAWRSPPRPREDEMPRAVETVKHFSPGVPGSCRCESACALFCMYAACASTMGTWTSGLLINHTCCDRAVLEQLHRRIVQHNLLHNERLKESTSEGQARLLHLTGWPVQTGCGLHDVENGFKRGGFHHM